MPTTDTTLNSQIPARVKNLTGRIFARLTVLDFAGFNARRTAYWFCRCVCGKKIKACGAELRRGKIMSCGCLHRDRLTSHGMAGTRTFRIWTEMKRRCCNPERSDYYNYGGRGIAVCPQWLASFTHFLADMGKCPSSQHSIERIDNNKGYAPDNCAWATMREQSRNKRTNHLLTANGETHPLIVWSEITGVERSVISYRLEHGGTPEEALGFKNFKERGGRSG